MFNVHETWSWAILTMSCIIFKWLHTHIIYKIFFSQLCDGLKQLGVYEVASGNKFIIAKWWFEFQSYECAWYEIYILIIIHWALLEIYKNPLIYSQIESFQTHTHTRFGLVLWHINHCSLLIPNPLLHINSSISNYSFSINIGFCLYTIRCQNNSISSYSVHGLVLFDPK